MNLEVHRAITALRGDPGPGGQSVLPLYVRRAHDLELEQVVNEAEAGASRIAVLVGGSSTGKTRACWEALAPLRRSARPWRLWHPINPTRPEAALAGLSRVGPHTVVWLNEAQDYLTHPVLGERVAAGLRELLNDPARAPVLVLATLWPDHWRALTDRDGIHKGGLAEGGPYRQARELLVDHKIKIPDAFTDIDLSVLSELADADPRLHEAAGYAAEGRITQYLAGAPVLTDRYQDATPATQAVIHVAMDARRLGCGPYIPLMLLAEAAPDYLTDAQWQQAGDNWLEEALSYLAVPCNGIPGMLTRMRSTPVRSPRSPRHGSPITTGDGPGYRLADYLEQFGRRLREAEVPPVGFWIASAAHADRADLPRLAQSAYDCGLYRDAAQMWRTAAAHGDAVAAARLVRVMHDLGPADDRPARWAATRISLGDARGVSALLLALRDAKADGQIEVLLSRDPGAKAGLDGPYAVIDLFATLRALGAQAQAVLLARRAAAGVRLDDRSPAVSNILQALLSAGEHDEIAALVERAASDAARRDRLDMVALLDDLRRSGDDRAIELVAKCAGHLYFHDGHDRDDMAELLGVVMRSGTREQLVTLAERVAVGTSLGSASHVCALLALLQEAELAEFANVLLARSPASHVFLDDLQSAGELLAFVHSLGAHDQAATLIERAARHVTAHGSHRGAAELLCGLAQMGSFLYGLTECVSAYVMTNRAADFPALLRRLYEAEPAQRCDMLAEYAVTYMPLDNARQVSGVLYELELLGLTSLTAALLARDPAAHVSVDHVGDVARLLLDLRRAEAHQQVVTLLARLSGAEPSLDDPDEVNSLLTALHAVEGDDQIAAVLARDPAARVAVDDCAKVGRLLRGLQQLGAEEQVVALAGRAAAYASLDDLHSVTALLGDMWWVDTRDEGTALARRTVEKAAPDTWHGVFALVAWLTGQGLKRESVTLLLRAAASLPLEHMHHADGLVAALRHIEEHELAADLIARLPAGKMFPLFLKHIEAPGRFHFGREPDGTPAPPWSWDDLT
ncbi:hypothetical protein ACFFOP_24195 [Sinosporangium siamense]